MATNKEKEKETKEGYVRIKLFKDNGRYKDDVFVSVNDKTVLVKRGVWVEVPEAIAEVIEHSEQQDYQTSLLIERYEKEAERAEREFS